MKARICILSILILLGTGMAARAQKVSLNTDLVDWGYFGTINLEAGISVSQHFSLMAGARYNPWEFKTRLDKDMYKKQITEYVGARWWPWYVYSGWWVGAKVQHSYFSETGMWRPALENKQAIGAGLSGGYTLMLHKNLNLEFSAGLWGGRYYKYKLYECPECMVLRTDEPRNFLDIEDISISIMYIF